MKSILIFLLPLLTCLLTTPVASAQNGAQIYKYPDYLVIFSELNSSQDVLALGSSDSNAYCGGDSTQIPYEITWTLRPDGFWKYHDSGYFFTRVFQVTPDDLEDLETDYCLIWSDTELLLADGMTFGVTNTSPQGYGYTLTGNLYDSADLCNGDMVNLHIVRKWKYLGAEEIPHVLKGPRLNCSK